MGEQLVSFETAKLAKEKGFNITTLDSFYLNGETIMEISVEDYPFTPFNWNSNTEFDFARPTQALLQKWLREVHNIHIDIRINAVSGGNYFFYLSQTRAPFYTLFVSEKESDSYEEALEYALKESLKLIKK